ncbi:MAG: class I SAM-dependent DNA methyltransferase [Thermoanaerobaculia bacterium]
MTPSPRPSEPALAAFISRWQASSGAERANKDLFLSELCDALGVPRPGPTTGDPEKDLYVFEKDAPNPNEGGRVTTGKIDLYKEGCFLLEAKQGSEAGDQKIGTAKRGTGMWGFAMQAAYGQACQYTQAFDAPPPFLIVCDIGYCFDLYATFDGSWNFRHFPDAKRHRIFLADLPAHADTLRTIFTDPHRLDPAKNAAKVTREIATHLAELARGLEVSGHRGERIAAFLMRCIFTMFAEDVGLLPKGLFATALERDWIKDPTRFVPEVTALWHMMNTGGTIFGVGKILTFNGGLFADPEALPLTKKQLEHLLEAAKTDWVDVEPAIFGTLLERALDPKERHALGAHFTPRAYVERLVRPTIEEPLRADWDVVRAEAFHLADSGKEAAARSAVHAFHKRLCEVRVLDPACGTGNFLYVTLDLMKRLESEVLGLLADLGEKESSFEVDQFAVTPAQFHGLEIKPWAKEIAELVLWIGYLQWQLRSKGDSGVIHEPILQEYGNIECRDAVLASDGTEPVLDENGKPVTRWDGETMKVSPITGEPIPDESKRVKQVRVINPRRAEWPEVDYVVGNPPFIGTKRMRALLGDGYVDALRCAYSADVEDNADFVMYWWHKAASLLEDGKLRRFGLITTNSLTQTFNRRVVARHLEKGVRIAWAIPDHPWADTETGAAVRIAMTCAAKAEHVPVARLAVVTAEESSEDPAGAAHLTIETRSGALLHEDLRMGADVAGAQALRSNDGIAGMGVALHGAGFNLEPAEAARLRLSPDDPTIRPYLGGRDLLQSPRERYLIDFSSLAEDDARRANPAAFQLVMDRVLPERRENRRESIRKLWWRFGWERPVLRKALTRLTRFVVTPETAKHRVFQFIDGRVLPDHKVVAIASEDSYDLGVLSSRAHTTWAIAAGGHLGAGNDPVYNKTRCFDAFPFPACNDEQAARIRELAEQLDVHRKTQQAQHPALTMTGMYNVLARLRSGEALSAKEKIIHEQGLVSLLKQLHDDLDAAVFDAYCWPATLSDEEILERLVALNAARAEEERNGLIRWLRPDFQHPGGRAPDSQTAFSTGEMTPAPVAAGLTAQPWPKALPERIAAVRDLLRSRGAWSPATVTAAFTGAKAREVRSILDSLRALGLVSSTVGIEGPSLHLSERR